MASAGENERAHALAEVFGALSHPVRIRALRQFEGGGTLSPGGLHEAMPDVPLGTLAYHVRQLARAGLLKAAGRAHAEGKEDSRRPRRVGLQAVGVPESWDAGAWVSPRSVSSVIPRALPLTGASACPVGGRWLSMDTQRRRLPAALQFIAVAAALAGVLSAIYIGFFPGLC